MQIREAIEKARELLKLKVNLISLVHGPANRKPIVVKADGSWESEMVLLHKDEAEGIVYGVVYEPDTVDSQGDWATARTIKEAAYDFLAAGRVNMIDMQHDYNPDKGTVVESYILRGTDPLFPNTKTGAWCVGIKLSAAAKSHMKDINGLSLSGSSAASPNDKSDDSSNGKTPLVRVRGALKKGKQTLFRIRNNNR